jgi:ATP-binding cassette subfamily B protein
VDNTTEEKILQGIQRRIQASTAVIIAHRVSTVMHCDYIMVLDEGKMVQWGQHEDLIKEKGVYATLFELQNDPNAE